MSLKKRNREKGTTKKIEILLSVNEECTFKTIFKDNKTLSYIHTNGETLKRRIHINPR